MVSVNIKLGKQGRVHEYALEALARTDQSERLDIPFRDLDEHHREVVIRAKRRTPNENMGDVLLGMTCSEAIDLAINIIEAATKQPLDAWERATKK